MTLLTICQDVAADVGVAVPATVIGNDEPTAVRLLAAARREAYALSRLATWTALVKEHSFATTTAASAQDGGLPDDFDYLVDGTAWDRANRRPLIGPLGAEAWQTLQAASAAPALGRRFRIVAGAFHLYPTPAVAGEEIAYEYVTNEVVRAADDTGRTTWQADDDVFVLSEDLAAMGVKWRFRKAVGLAYDDDLAEYLGAVDRAVARDGGSPSLRLDGTGAGAFGANLPEADFPEA